MKTLDIDPDVRVARTPPSWLYTDRDVHAHLREKVWRPGWSLLLEPDPTSDQRVVPCDVSGEPTVWVRDEQGERLLSNVCTHRAATIVDAPCKSDVLRCPYHGRRFRLDGSVLAAPGFEGALGPEDALPSLALGKAGTLRFGAVEPAIPFESWWASVDEALAVSGLDLATLTRDPDGDVAYPIDAPWLLYLENYLESFHIPFVHPELSRTLSLEEYGHDLLPHGTLQVGIAREGQPAFEPTSGRYRGQRVGAWWFWLWPATLVNVYPWGVSLNRIDDAGFGKCVVRYRAWVWDPSLRKAGAGGALDLVEAQDQSVALRAWAGLQGTLYRRGRYSPTQESGMHHFHRMLATALG
jgi:choline monooxygenase